MLLNQIKVKYVVEILSKNSKIYTTVSIYIKLFFSGANAQMDWTKIINLEETCEIRKLE